MTFDELFAKYRDLIDSAVTNETDHVFLIESLYDDLEGIPLENRRKGAEMAAKELINMATTNTEFGDSSSSGGEMDGYEGAEDVPAPPAVQVGIRKPATVKQLEDYIKR